MTAPGAPAATSALPLWLGLILTPGLGQRGAQRLLEQFSTAEAIYAASLTELEACVPGAVAQHLHDGRAAALGAREAEQAAAQSVQVITLADPTYPELLREIYDPPIVLYVRGAAAALDSFGVAAVGTRRPSVYGRVMAERLGRELAQWGLTVVSGLARGIDSIGQKACLEAGGRTVAVLGTGVDVIYPSENRRLAEAILAGGGALVSEFPLATAPTAQNFPIRNRVISGMTLGVLVIEGGEYSGSRITARMALEQNRDVFAVPGMATQKQAWLPNALIKQGAKLVTEAADIVEELPSAVRERLTPPPPAVQAAAAPARETEPGAADKASETNAAAAVRRRVLEALAVDAATQVDEVLNSLQNNFSAPEILAHLFDLELEGKIRQLPGKKYLRVS
ncbi:MAG: DNA-processing protein DprA [Terriglobales bacterium]